MGIRLSGRYDNPLQLRNGEQWRRVQLQWPSTLWDRGTRSGAGQDRPSRQLSTECIRTVRHARQRVGMVLGRVRCGLLQELAGVRSSGTLRGLEPGAPGAGCARSLGAACAAHCYGSAVEFRYDDVGFRVALSVADGAEASIKPAKQDSQAATTLASDHRQDGFVPLFNGTDLDQTNFPLVSHGTKAPLRNLGIVCRSQNPRSAGRGRFRRSSRLRQAHPRLGRSRRRQLVAQEEAARRAARPAPADPGARLDAEKSLAAIASMATENRSVAASRRSTSESARPIFHPPTVRPTAFVRSMSKRSWPTGSVGRKKS